MKKLWKVLIITMVILIISLFFFIPTHQSPILSYKIKEPSNDGGEGSNTTDSSYNNLNESQEYQKFLESCKNKNGGVILNRNEMECYKISKDAESSCQKDSECVYNCDFSQAVNSQVCILAKTDKDLAKNIYTYEYDCSVDSPGKCSSLPILDAEWEMDRNKLIETGQKEFPQEKSEFSPV